MKNKGYTLLEVLIALAVFAILATITSSAIYHAFNTRAKVSVQAERLNKLQLAITLVARDTEQAVERAVRGEVMRLFPAFIGQPYKVEFTRGGVANPNSKEKRSTLQRIALLCQNNQLIRRSWKSLDTTNRHHYSDRVLLDNLTKCRFSYLNHNLQVLTEWRDKALEQNQQKEPFPKAIQMNLALADWGTMSYLLILPRAL